MSISSSLYQYGRYWLTKQYNYFYIYRGFFMLFSFFSLSFFLYVSNIELQFIFFWFQITWVYKDIFVPVLVRFDSTIDYCPYSPTIGTQVPLSLADSKPQFIPLHSQKNSIPTGQPVQPILPPSHSPFNPPLPSTSPPGSQWPSPMTSFGLHLACISVPFHSLCS